MTKLLAEQPLLLSIMLGVLAAALLFGWLQTGKKAVGAAGLLIACLIPVAWYVADNWVTDSERIEMIVRQVADDVANNRHDAVLAVIGDEQTKAQAAGELPRYEFSSARVGSIQYIRVDETKSPKQAEVNLIAQVVASEKRGSIKNIKVPRRLILQFEQTSPEKWVVIGYQHGPLTGGPDGYSSRPILHQ